MGLKGLNLFKEIPKRRKPQNWRENSNLVFNISITESPMPKTAWSSATGGSDAVGFGGDCGFDPVLYQKRKKYQVPYYNS